MVAANGIESRFLLSESMATKLAAEFGTPLYVVDEDHFRNRIREYRDGFASAYPNSEITFASKANSTLAILAIAHQEGCGIDVASEGELRAALAAGVPASRCHLHGNNKSLEEIEFALGSGIGQIVVDHFGEIELLRQRFPLGDTEILIRLAPGVDPITHEKISTGQADTKFGFNIEDGSAEKAVRICLDTELPLVGFHCHVGSQLLDPTAQRSGGELIARFAAETKQRYGLETKVLNVGGGLGVRYTDNDRPQEIAEYSCSIVESVSRGLDSSGLKPKLCQEPGRSLIAESGVTLYRVGVIKRVPIKEGSRTYVAVDGGLSDNPRPALYGSKYTVLRAAKLSNGQSQVTETVTISGKHCETDKLFGDVTLPGDLGEGDLLQVLCTGAYNASMASNYNRYPRPATVLIRTHGGTDLIQRRETWDELLQRESLPADLAVTPR